MQIAQAFGQVQNALSFFVTAYSSIADWKAVLNRLAGFDASMDWAKGLDADRAQARAGEQRRRRAGGGRPCRRPAQWRGDRARVGARHRPRRAGAGDRTLGRGQDEPVPRAWRRVAVRHRDHQHPRRCEPACAAAAALSAARQLARRARLSRAGGCLPAEPRSRRCSRPSGSAACATSSTRRPIGPTGSRAGSSSGCRSRARCCRSRTGSSSTRRRAALDEAAEAALYRLLLKRLPDTAIVSIGHRASLVQFHARFFELEARGNRAASSGRSRAA